MSQQLQNCMTWNRKAFERAQRDNRPEDAARFNKNMVDLNRQITLSEGGSNVRA